MKIKYEEPQINIITFYTKDIITISIETGTFGGGDDEWGEGFGF